VQWAEHSGFQDDVDFFEGLEAAGAAAAGAGPTIFYDSTCGIPLFVAPVGRSFAEWRTESRNHGWPSFRDAEVVSFASLVIKGGGEVRSTCGTHLGHNLPDGSGNRYCIDLVCMAGHPNAAAANSSGTGGYDSLANGSGGSVVSIAIGTAAAAVLAACALAR
jgi:peptide methionine sulfoxide reductase MsrB